METKTVTPNANPKVNPNQAKIDQNKRMVDNLSNIKNQIVVFSGKGGVGKSTVTTNLSYTLLKKYKDIGLLDADITGPNIPKMVGSEDQPYAKDKTTIYPIDKNGLKLISMAPLIPKNEAVIWRGPLRTGVITQFLSDVVWGKLDILLSDLPPGTGDEILTLVQTVKPKIAIIVTTPQEVSLQDCRRAISMAKKLNIPKIAVVENMAGLICPHCGDVIDFFGKGGGEKMAKEMEVEFLGSIPMEMKNRECGDDGTPIVLKYPESITTKAFTDIANKIEKLLEK
ncbi:MAG: Mrp/NBP35 family ATP-binding protein [Candidatus Marinimicrobia bacterium]|nr:Mrp/NBP35 family ATP-binding protein [Candidatus Neomarinimicrobiota bacterium]